MRKPPAISIFVVLGVILLAGHTLAAGLTAAWRQAWEDFDRNYSYFSYKKVDWDRVWAEHQSDFETVTSATDFADKLNDILQVLRDWHVTVRKPNGETIGYRGSVRENYHPTKLIFPRYTTGGPYENLKNLGVIIHARVATNFAHVVVLTLGSRFTDNLSELDLESLFRRYESASGIILDLRANSGGNENNARMIAGRFTDQPRTYGYVRTRLPGADRAAFTEFTPKTLSPSSSPRFQGKVVGLVGQRTISSAEAFALMIRSLPQGTLIGDGTRGASGNPVEKGIPELEVRYTISTWMAFDDQKRPLENVGIVPDLRMPASASYDEERDYVLETAIAYLQGGQNNAFGIPDSWVLQHRLNLTATSDADGDGFLDRHEYLAGTDPTDAGSLLRVLSVAPAAAGVARVVSWASVPGKRYALHRASHVGFGLESDVVVQDHLLSTGAVTSVRDSSALGPGPWFYRVELETGP